MNKEQRTENKEQRTEDLWTSFLNELDTINTILYLKKEKLLQNFFNENNMTDNEIDELKEDFECDII